MMDPMQSAPPPPGRRTRNDQQANADRQHDSIAPSLFDPTGDTRDIHVPEGVDRGRRLRDDGQRRAEQNAHEGWKSVTRRSIERWADRRVEFTSDDVIEECGFALASSENSVGALMSGAARRGIIRKTGAYVPSRRASRHASVIAVWIGTTSRDAS